MLISVFTPTYNRADLIHRVFNSLCAQDFAEFEWIILDDGSTDNTIDVLNRFRDQASFPIKISFRENRGKAQSINEGVDFAEGELFICFDSDDWCESNAFTRIATIWKGLSSEERRIYAGISCLKRLTDGALVGEDYARMRTMGETYVDRFNRRIKGDKWEIIRTDLLKLARYDLYDGEKYMAPEYAWLKIGVDYRTVFLNEALSIVEYQPGGISLNNLSHRVASPVSTMRFYYLAWSVSDGIKNRLRASINYMRFRFHAKMAPALPFVAQLFASIPGWLFYRRDLASLAKMAKRRDQ